MATTASNTVFSPSLGDIPLKTFICYAPFQVSYRIHTLLQPHPRPVLNRLCHMIGCNQLTFRQINNRPGQLQHSMKSSCDRCNCCMAAFNSFSADGSTLQKSRTSEEPISALQVN